MITQYVILKLKWAPEPPLGLVKTQTAEPVLIISDSVGLRWGPKIVLLAR